MFKNLTGARLGVFVFLGTILLVIAVFLIGNKDSLFASTYTVKTYFKNVEGLRSGASVRLSGIDIGSVSDIEIAGDTTGRVMVTMRIKSDIKDFVRQDSKASIETEGLVGNKIVVISVGSVSFSEVKDGGFIKSKSPVSIAQIIEESQGTLNYIKNISKDFSEIVSKVNKGEGTIGKLINDDELYVASTRIINTGDNSLKTITEKLGDVTNVVTDVSGEFKKIVKDIDVVIQKVDAVMDNVKNGKGILGSLVAENSPYNDSLQVMLKNVLATTEEIKLGASKFSENMEALKHNWLFKSYFEKRGYWDTDEYERTINLKILELKERTRLLDEKIQELNKLESKIEKERNRKETNR